HDVGLDQLIGGVARVSGRHQAFVEGALRAVAVVAAVAQDDGALLLHRVIGGIDARAAEHGRQVAGLRITTQRGPLVRLALGYGGHEPRGDVRQGRAQLGGTAGVDAAHQVVLLVGHDPRAGRVSVVPGGGVSEVGGLHGAVAVVTTVDLGVAVVETATIVEMVTVDDPVLPLRLVADRGAGGMVVA